MTKEEKKLKNKLYYESNKEKRKKEYEENKETYLEKSKEYRDKNKDKIKEQRKEYREKNKDKLNLYFKNRKSKDIIFKLRTNLSSSISNLLKRKDLKKISKTELILGCSFQDFKEHLESQFEDWMTWDNYGLYNGTLNYGWDIDHIIPTSSANDIFTILKLNHYTNLKPLCSKVNRDIKKAT